MSNKRRKDSPLSPKKKVTPYYDLPDIVPMNLKQKEYINAIRNGTVTCSTGVAGSGKTWIAAVLAADMLLDPSNTINKIIIARPNEIEGTRSIGLLPGDIKDKMAPLIAPLADALKSRIGESHYNYLVDNGTIEFLPLEYIKGKTFSNTFVICDEIEDMEWSILKALLLRVGRNSKLVLNGDLRQTAISRESGLQVLWRLMDDYYLPIRHIDFDSWDYCVRSDECRIFGETFEEARV